MELTAIYPGVCLSAVKSVSTYSASSGQDGELVFLQDLRQLLFSFALLPVDVTDTEIGQHQLGIFRFVFEEDVLRLQICTSAKERAQFCIAHLDVRCPDRVGI
jgi:hypothetical protein